jgi:hypothetical protein
MTVLAMADGHLLPVPQATLPRVEPAFLKRLLQTGDRGWSDSIPAPEGPSIAMTGPRIFSFPFNPFLPLQVP